MIPSFLTTSPWASGSVAIPTTAGGYNDLLYIPRFWCAVLLLPLNAFCPYVLMLFFNPPTIGANRHRRFVNLLITLLCLYLGSVLMLPIENSIQHKEPNIGATYSHILAWLAITVQLHGFAAVQADNPVWWIHVASWVVLCVLELDTAIDGFLQHPTSPSKVLSSLSIGLAFSKVFVSFTLIFWFFRQQANPEQGTCSDNASSDNKRVATKPSGMHQDAMDEIKSLGGYLPWLRKFTIFWQFAWLGGQPWLQARFFASIFIVLGRSYVGYLIPLKYSELLNSLNEGAPEAISYRHFFLWISLKVVASPLVLGSAQNHFLSAISQFRKEKLQVTAHSKIMSLDSSYHSSVTATETIKAVDYAGSVDTLLDGLFFGLLANAFKFFLGASGMITLYGPWVTLVVICVVVLYVILEERGVAILTRKRDKYNTLRTKKDVRRQDGVHGWSTATNHNRISFEVDSFKNAVVDWLAQWRSYYLSALGVQYCRSLLLQCGTGAATLLVMIDVMCGRRVIGDLIALAGFWDLLLSSVDFFASCIGDQLDTLLDANRFRRILERKPGAEDGNEGLILAKGEIKFRDVTFAYPGSKKNVLDGMSLHIEGGSKVGIVGPSGTGKSTLLQLLMRQVRTIQGTILVDGQALNNLTIDSLHNYIGRMEQSPYYFKSSVMSNVKYARPEATDEEVHEACRLACIHDAIMERKDKYDTSVGENGNNFSGGELQRIGIARLFLKNPKIVLIDEGTSALDAVTEGHIRHNLEQKFPKSTMIIIAHRLSTVRNLDHIYFLGDGCQVLEDGTHGELVARGERYAKAWRLHCGENNLGDLT